MKRILVINPNTSVAVTERVLAHCRQALPNVAWDGATGRFGAAYISSEAAYAIAAHATLDAFAAAYLEHDAVLLACFGDPGLLALRELADVPVIGLAEASFIAAAQQGKFAVVTGGMAWVSMLKRFARTHQLDSKLVGVHTIDLTGAQIAAAPDRAIDGLLAACRQGVASGAQCIVLGGAALAGLSGELQSRLAVPVLDNVSLGAQAAAAATTRPRAVARAATALRGEVVGLSRELSARWLQSPLP